MVVGWVSEDLEKLFAERSFNTGDGRDNYSGPRAGCNQGDLMPTSSRGNR
jgi:hypothetical protein